MEPKRELRTGKLRRTCHAGGVDHPWKVKQPQRTSKRTASRSLVAASLASSTRVSRSSRLID